MRQMTVPALEASDAATTKPEAAGHAGALRVASDVQAWPLLAISSFQFFSTPPVQTRVPSAHERFVGIGMEQGPSSRSDQAAHGGLRVRGGTTYGTQQVLVELRERGGTPSAPEQQAGAHGADGQRRLGA